jgi:hypothetical protein
MDELMNNLELVFTLGVYGFAVMALVLRGAPSLAPAVARLAQSARHMGESDFYCFFPTRSLAVRRGL